MPRTAGDARRQLRRIDCQLPSLAPVPWNGRVPVSSSSACPPNEMSARVSIARPDLLWRHVTDGAG